jgi:predicted transglutaminase-like cysteine proteinase
MTIPPTAWPRRRAATALLVVLCLASPRAQSQLDLGYTARVSATLKAKFAQKFGAGTMERIDDWIRYGGSQKQAREEQRRKAPASDLEALNSVNKFFNRVRYAEDIKHWGQDDYWAAPIELVSSNGGDCEDYAIAKYYLLKELGVPIERLRITYVKSLKLNQAHMVLAYYSAPGAEPLILDNLDERIRPASERDDLDPVYSFNDDQVELAKTGQKGVPTQLRAWQTLQGRLRAHAQGLLT